MAYGFFATLEGPFEATVERVTQALKKEGFGILSEIDVQKAMRDKLGLDIPPHRILGACNPQLAHQALGQEPNVSMLLPCNVTLREVSSGRTLIGFLDPDTMVSLTGNAALRPVAEEAGARLRRACADLGNQAISTHSV